LQLELAIGVELWTRPRVSLFDNYETLLCLANATVQARITGFGGADLSGDIAGVLEKESSVIQLFEVVRGAGFEPARHFWH